MIYSLRDIITQAEFSRYVIYLHKQSLVVSNIFTLAEFSR